jgi:hypothetical protein
MKIPIRVGVSFLLLFSCNNTENVVVGLNAKMPLTILNCFSVVDTSSSIIVNIINPDDCLSCITVANNYFQNLNKIRLPKQNFLFIFPSTREIERSYLLEKFSLSKDLNNLIFNDSILDLFNKVFMSSDFTSYLVVYNKKLRWQNSMQITKLNRVEEVNYMIPEK